MRRPWILFVLILALNATVTLAADEQELVGSRPYAEVELVSPATQGFEIRRGFDENNETHTMRVEGDKIGAIFQWKGEDIPNVTQSAVGGSVHLNVKPSAPNCCIIAYTRWPSDWDFACDPGCADCGCMLCFNFCGQSTGPGSVETKTKLTFGPAGDDVVETEPRSQKVDVRTFGQRRN